jgi:hypothetical protein
LHKLPELGEALVKALELAREHEANHRLPWSQRR